MIAHPGESDRIAASIATTHPEPENDVRALLRPGALARAVPHLAEMSAVTPVAMPHATHALVSVELTAPRRAARDRRRDRAIDVLASAMRAVTLVHRVPTRVRAAAQRRRTLHARSDQVVPSHLRKVATLGRAPVARRANSHPRRSRSATPMTTDAKRVGEVSLARVA
jgi:hypothetical protein